MTQIVQYEDQMKQKTRRVFFTGTGALLQGQGVCYERDYVTTSTGETINDSWGLRGNAVGLPDADNCGAFAGVTDQAYAADANGQWITIIEPGSVAEISIGLTSESSSATVADQTRLTVAGVGAPGTFGHEGFAGRGSAIALQSTDGSHIIDSSVDDGWDVHGTNKNQIVDLGSGGFANVSVGDYVYIIGEAHATIQNNNAGRYTVTSVIDSSNITIDSDLTAVDSKLAGFIISGNFTIPAYLEDGPESGCIEYIKSVTTGDTASLVLSPIGKSYFVAATVASANSQETMPAGSYGQTKAFHCLGAIATSDIEIAFPSGSFQNTVATGTGVALALADISFDGAGDQSYVFNVGGVWREEYSTTGVTTAAS